MSNFNKARKKARQAAQYDFEVHGKARPFASGAAERSAWVKWYFEEFNKLENSNEQ